MSSAVPAGIALSFSSVHTYCCVPAVVTGTASSDVFVVYLDVFSVGADPCALVYCFRTHSLYCSFTLLYGGSTNSASVGNVVAGGCVGIGVSLVDSAVGCAVAGGCVGSGVSLVDSAVGCAVAGGCVGSGASLVGSTVGCVVAGDWVVAGGCVGINSSSSAKK